MADPAFRSSDPVLKVVSPPATTRRAASLYGVWLQYRRLILLVALPLAVALVGLALYLMGGRYITTDNAYVGAQKVLITPDIDGKISRVVVVEGQQVAAGDVLFEIDPVPFGLALTQAESRLATVRTELANLKTNLRSLGQLIELARQTVALKQNDVDRKSTLFASRTGSAAEADLALAALAQAKRDLELLLQQEAQLRNQLLGEPDLPLEMYPPSIQAAAALAQARRDLDHTIVRAPIAGRATQVDAIQLGRYVSAGTPVFSIIDDAHPWVDANPKETDITHLQLGQKAFVYVDTFPGHTLHGTVTSVSPGTGAQFAILPPQNASGNWVKVVQRVPVRITFNPGQSLHGLRAGMSATVEIDTRRRRTLASPFGESAAAKDD